MQSSTQLISHAGYVFIYFIWYYSFLIDVFLIFPLGNLKNVSFLIMFPQDSIMTPYIASVSLFLKKVVSCDPWQPLMVVLGLEAVSAWMCKCKGWIQSLLNVWSFIQSYTSWFSDSVCQPSSTVWSTSGGKMNTCIRPLLWRPLSSLQGFFKFPLPASEKGMETWPIYKS